MKKLRLFQNDFHEAESLAKSISTIDQINFDEESSMADEMLKYQPFFFNVLLGEQNDLTKEEFKEVRKIYFLIWDYFRLQPNMQTRELTQDDFYKSLNKNLQMMQQSESLNTQNKKAELFQKDLQNLKSKALMAAVLMRFNKQSPLVKLNATIRSQMFVSFKSFIDCFDIHSQKG